ncbi:kinase-like domain-containing protein [Rhizophagus clarus]|nr:kinase-like domain-containing protein [Rhizophagus clarus]
MIMWEFTSGIPLSKYRAYDLEFILSICNGERPKIIENTPQCYIDLMEKCWDSDPENRPTIMDLEHKISEWVRCIDEHYEINNDDNNNNRSYRFMLNNDKKATNDMFEFVNASNTQVQELTNVSHPQAYYTSRKLTEILTETSDKENSEDYSEFMIKD